MIYLSVGRREGMSGGGGKSEAIPEEGGGLCARHPSHAWRWWCLNYGR